MHFCTMKKKHSKILYEQHLLIGSVHEKLLRTNVRYGRRRSGSRSLLNSIPFIVYLLFKYFKKLSLVNLFKMVNDKLSQSIIAPIFLIRLVFKAIVSKLIQTKIQFLVH